MSATHKRGRKVKNITMFKTALEGGADFFILHEDLPPSKRWELYDNHRADSLEFSMICYGLRAGLI